MNKFFLLPLLLLSLHAEITEFPAEKLKHLNLYLNTWKDNNYDINTQHEQVHKTIDRVIIAVNENPKYLFFWPYISKAWSHFIGIKPTLIYIGDKKISISDEYGEVIYIPPVEGVPTVFQSQCVRLLAPALFPEEQCIIADIDQIPINAEYFHRPVEVLDEEAFIIYESLPNIKKQAQRIEFRMSYNAAKGRIFGEIFGAHTKDEIRKKLHEWYHLFYKEHRYHSDQAILFHYLSRWKNFDKNCFHLRRHWRARAYSPSRAKKVTNNSGDKVYTATPDACKKLQKAYYVEAYLEKGDTPYNHLVFELLDLE